MIQSIERLQRLGRKAIRRALPRLPWRVRPVILMYHRIDEASFDPWGLSVPPSLFAMQMEWLAGNRTVLSLAEFAELHEKHAVPREAVVLTFDDGYASVAETAAPILERLRLPATIFIPVDAIDRRRSFWWDKLAGLIIGFEGERLSIGDKDFELGAPEAGDAAWAPNAEPSTRRQRLFWQVWSDNRTRPIEEIDRMVDQLAGQTTGVPAASDLMTPQQVRSVNTATVKIGSHGLSHSSLPGIGTGRKRAEICESIERCAALTGERPLTFAYPFGDYDDESRSIVEECGYACACTVEGRPVTESASNSSLPRVGVGNWDAELMERVLLEL